MQSEHSVVDPLAPLAEEFLGRLRAGERPTLAEYLERYPEFAERIRNLFPMLAMMEQAGSGGTLTAPVSLPTPAIEFVGGYRILREIGRGGMGIVYEAEQLSLGRRVALKILPIKDASDGQSLERFQREAKAAARLHHTNIVPVYEVGEDGAVCFYAMQFIAGQPLDRVLDELRKLRSIPQLSPNNVSVAHSLLAGFSAQKSAAPEASSSMSLPGGTDPSSISGNRSAYFRSVARVGVQVAQALEHAHKEGIIHRDIKPSNLLLDIDGRVWVADFGLARTEGSNLTQTGEIVGTLRYMAPERFRGWADPRSDVYALGLTLYEMLLLRPAFEAPDYLNLVRQLMNEEPTRPRRIDASIPRDLETVVLKAIDKEPSRRYQSATDLAADLQRFLDDQPVRARSTTTAERAWRWCRRNPTVAALVVVGLVALVALVGMGVASSYNTRLTRALDDAEDKGKRLEQNAYFQGIALAEREWWNNNVGRTEELLDLCPQRQRGWEWRYLKRLCHLDLQTLRHSGIVTAVAVAPESKKLFATASFDGSLQIWDEKSGVVLRSLNQHSNAISAISFSSDGAFLASVGELDGEQMVAIWDVASGKLLRRLGPLSVGIAWCLAISPDGKAVAVGGGYTREPGFLHLWDTTTGKLIRRCQGHTREVVAVAFTPDGKLISASGTIGDYFLTRHRIGEIKVWDTQGKVVSSFQPHNSEVACLAVSPDGTRVATGDWNSVVHIWEAETRKKLQTLRGHAYGVTGVAFSPDSQRVVTAGVDMTVRLWDAVTAEELTVLRGHTRWVNQVAFLSDGQRVISASDDATAKIWDTARSRECQTYSGHGNVAHAVLFRAEASRLALFSEDDRVTLRDSRVGRDLAVFRMPNITQSCVALSPDDSLLAAGSGIVGFGGTSKALPGTIKVWEVVSGKVIHEANFKEGITHVNFSPKGKWIAVASAGTAGGEMKIWQLPHWGQPQTIALKVAESNGYVAFSPDERRLVCLARGISGGEFRSKLLVFRLSEEGIWKQEREIPDDSITVIPWRPFSADGNLLAVASRDYRVKVFDIRTGDEVHALRGHKFWVIDAAFSPDGKRLATASLDRTVIIWDTQTGQQTLTLRGHSDRVVCVRWSEDGNRLSSCTTGGEVKIWSAEPPERETDHGQ